MRKIQVYAEVFLERFTKIGLDKENQVVLCEVMGKQVILIECSENNLFFQAEHNTGIEILKNHYLKTKESRKRLSFLKQLVVNYASTAYIPSAVVSSEYRKPLGSQIAV